MASPKQIAANQRNAARSTGPKSAEGKAKVARNALKHGLAGHGVVLPEEMAEQIQERQVFFWKALKPDGPMQRWMFERICIESVRADVCLHQSIALRDEASKRASESWDDDRALEAEELGATLASKPERVQPRLRQSKHGALWLLAQWEELERLWEVRGAWTESATTRAMDLLGLAAEGREGAWEALSSTDAEGEGVRNLIRGEIAALQRRLDDYLEGRDDRARADAEAGLDADSPELRRLGRYEGEILRRLRAWTRELRRLQGPASGPGSPGIGGGGRGPSDDRPPSIPPSAPIPGDAATFEGPRRVGSPPADDLPMPNPDAARTTPSPMARMSPPFSASASASATPMNRRTRRARAAIARRSPRA